jgi:hypothetical protein
MPIGRTFASNKVAVRNQMIENSTPIPARSGACRMRASAPGIMGDVSRCSFP